MHWKPTICTLNYKRNKTLSCGGREKALITAPVLALPSFLEKPFHLFVNVNKVMALEVLTENMGDNDSSGIFIQIVRPSHLGLAWMCPAATALLTEGSRKLTFGVKLIAPPSDMVIKHQRGGRWLTDSRILKYETLLLERDNLTFMNNKSLNPA